MSYGVGPRDWTPREAKIPPNYRCARCNMSGVKLWRPYRNIMDDVELLCVDCAEKDQGKKCKLELPMPEYSDQIGWCIPAVPAGDGFYWVYTSVPDEGCAWWDALPLKKGELV